MYEICSYMFIYFFFFRKFFNVIKIKIIIKRKYKKIIEGTIIALFVLKRK